MILVKKKYKYIERKNVKKTKAFPTLQTTLYKVFGGMKGGLVKKILES